jgi:hypothetical protein
VCLQQVEVACLFPGDTEPVPVERGRQVVEAPDDVEREIDGVDLDVSE